MRNPSHPRITNVPTHILTGFLGAGKTTVLRHLLTQKPNGEIWAVLMNEFGQIGLDGLLLQAGEGITVKEVAGGCLCCVSNLPMQIALTQLLSTFKPDRLFIEPTGLGHPQQLLAQLSTGQWQTVLNLRAVVTVVDGTQVGVTRLTAHETFLAQLAAADVVLVSHAVEMQQADQHALDALIAINAPHARVVLATQGEVLLSQVDLPCRLILEAVDHHLQEQSLLALAPTLIKTDLSADVSPDVSPKLPYHYAQVRDGVAVGGWRLPQEWVFERDLLLLWLLSLQDWQRIKGVLRVSDGWLAINFTPAQRAFEAHLGADDNLLELIMQPPVDWLALQDALMQCRAVRSD